MRLVGRFAFGCFAAFALDVALLPVSAAQSPVPVVAPVVVDTTVPIVLGAIKPKTNAAGLAKFQGFVMNATIAQITVRDKNNELSVRTFPLSEAASAKMQKIIDKGGYQYGDKVTVLYKPDTSKAIQVKGKASRPI